MAKTDAQIVREVLDRMRGQSNEEKAREITRVLGRRVRRRKPVKRGAAAARFTPVPIAGEPLSSTILRDRGTR